MAEKQEAAFEENLALLESIVSQLESGELSLDESLKVFEQGIKLTRLCQSSLAEAEQKVEILMNQNGKESLQPFTDQAVE